MLAAYSGMVRVWTSMSNVGTFDADLPDYTDAATAKKLISWMDTDNDRGLILRGAPKTNPKVAALNLTTNPATATVADCFDVRSWLPVFAVGPQKGESAVAPGQVIKPYVVTATLNRDPAKAGSVPDTDGWVVVGFNNDSDQAC